MIETVPSVVVEITESAVRGWIAAAKLLRPAGLLKGNDGPASARRSMLELLAGRSVRRISEDQGLVRVRSRTSQVDIGFSVRQEGTRLVVVAVNVREYL